MSYPQVSNLVGLGWELAFLTSPQVKLMVLVKASHLKNLSKPLPLPLPKAASSQAVRIRTVHTGSTVCPWKARASLGHTEGFLGRQFWSPRYPECGLEGEVHILGGSIDILNKAQTDRG